LAGRLIAQRCNLSSQLRVVAPSQQRISVVGNGNIGVGNQTPTLKPGGIAGQNPLKTEQPGICGAMSLQSGDNGRGNESAPQKFVRLVGCREASARPEPWVRPTPVKS
jgi:hypothetical protein